MGLYHERPKFAGNHPRRSVVVGRKEILESRPELGADWDAVNESFIVRVTRSFWEKAQKSEALARQVLPSRAELEQDETGLTDPVGEQGPGTDALGGS